MNDIACFSQSMDEKLFSKPVILYNRRLWQPYNYTDSPNNGMPDFFETLVILGWKKSKQVEKIGIAEILYVFHSKFCDEVWVDINKVSFK